LLSSTDLKTYFLISNSIVLKFEVNTVDAASKLEYFYDENVQKRYYCRPQYLEEEAVNLSNPDLSATEIAIQADQSEQYAFL